MSVKSSVFTPYVALTDEEVVSVIDDAHALVRLCNRQRCALYSSPAQSNFRVMAFLIITCDDKPGLSVVEGANMEQGWIGGAICAERAALSRLRFLSNPKIIKVVVTTDHEQPISPGMLCREYLMSSAEPHIDIIIGNGASTIVTVVSLESLFPYPYIYRNHSRTEVEAYACEISCCGAGAGVGVGVSIDGWNARQQKTYQAARLSVIGDTRASLHPVRLGAAVLFENGVIERTWVLKGLEYGCTMCPITQILRELEKKRFPQYCEKFTVDCPFPEYTQEIQKGDVCPLPIAETSASTSANADGLTLSTLIPVWPEGSKPECIAMVDQWGIAHAPFASARAILTEYGYGQVQILVHDNSPLPSQLQEERGVSVGPRAVVCIAEDLCPPPANGAFLTHDAFL